MIAVSEIKRVPVEVSGLPDAVELMASCAIARYRVKNGAITGVRGVPRVYPCKIMASYEDGTLSLSAPKAGFIISVRLDESMAVLREAAAARLDAVAQKGESNVEEDAASQG